MGAATGSRRRTIGPGIILALAALLWAPAPAPAQPATLVPARLRVDLPANNVIEPGEFFSVAPYWTNTSGSPVTFTGTASNFTGPTGATYTISVPTADYGTADPGATASCWETIQVECYSLHASDPAQRPAFHWDASFLETLSTGETKTWTLHVGRTFLDVSPTGPTYPFVETLVHNGVTSGCNTKPWFCPRATVTRGQLAVFLIRAIEGPGYVPPQPSGQRFVDVPPSHPFYAYIDQLGYRNISAGCSSSPPRYCPADPVTREQMAALILKAIEFGSYNPPAPSSQRFADVPPSNPFYEYIDQMAVRGITAGCSSAPPLYCPHNLVTREQMAVFLTRGFALELYGL
jgi:hypothetical protein